MLGGDNLKKRYKTVIKNEEQLKYRYLTTQRTDFLEQAILTNAKSWKITDHAAEKIRLIWYQQKCMIFHPITLKTREKHDVWLGQRTSASYFAKWKPLS